MPSCLAARRPHRFYVPAMHQCEPSEQRRPFRPRFQTLSEVLSLFIPSAFKTSFS